MLSYRDLAIPSTFEIIAAGDTGTYMSGVIAAIAPDDEAFVLEEFPNYRYVAGEIELTGLTVGEWFTNFGTSLRRYTRKPKNHAWCDRNTNFTTEVKAGLTLRRNFKHLELRTEITREYFQHGKVWLAPWLRVLPYELENARWPEDTTDAGRYQRLKKKDHTLDCLEHILSRRPRSKHYRGAGADLSLKDQMRLKLQQPQPDRGLAVDAHLGSN